MDSEELDELIAGALRSYSDGTPRPGLARRVMSRIAGVRPARRKFLPWAFAATAVIVSIASLRIMLISRPARQLPRELITRNEASTPVLIPQIPVQRPVLTRRAKVTSAVAPGAPDPLSDQERALLMLAKRVPLQAEDLLKPTEPEPIVHDPIAPIAIEQISIPPLGLGSDDGAGQ